MAVSAVSSLFSTLSVSEHRFRLNFDTHLVDQRGDIDSVTGSNIKKGGYRSVKTGSRKIILMLACTSGFVILGVLIGLLWFCSLPPADEIRNDFIPRTHDFNLLKQKFLATSNVDSISLRPWLGISVTVLEDRHVFPRKVKAEVWNVSPQDPAIDAVLKERNMSRQHFNDILQEMKRLNIYWIGYTRVNTTSLEMIYSNRGCSCKWILASTINKSSQDSDLKGSKAAVSEADHVVLFLNDEWWAYRYCVT